MRIAEGVYLGPNSGPISNAGSNKVRDLKSSFNAFVSSTSPEATSTSLGESGGGLSSQLLRSSSIAAQNSQSGCQKIKSVGLPNRSDTSTTLPDRSGSENFGIGSPTFL